MASGERSIWNLLGEIIKRPPRLTRKKKERKNVPKQNLIANTARNGLLNNLTDLPIPIHFNYFCLTKDSKFSSSV